MVQLSPQLVAALKGTGSWSEKVKQVLELWKSKRIYQRMRLFELALDLKAFCMWLNHSTRKFPMCHVWIQLDGPAPSDYKLSDIKAAIDLAIATPTAEEPTLRVLQPPLLLEADLEEGEMPDEPLPAVKWRSSEWGSSVYFQTNQRFAILGPYAKSFAEVTTMAAFFTAGAALWDPLAPGWNWGVEELLEKQGQIDPPFNVPAERADAEAVVALLQLLRDCGPPVA